MCQQDGDIEISLGNTQCYYQGEWKHVNNSYYFSNLPNLKKFSERFILQIFLDFSFLAKTITLPSLKLIALDIFWATQSQERDWSIFFERETWREEKACVVWLGGRETYEIVTVQTFKRKKKLTSGWAMKHGHFQASSFYDEKDEYPEMSEEKWQWFIIIQSFSIVQDPSPQLTLADSSWNHSHKKTLISRESLSARSQTWPSNQPLNIGIIKAIFMNKEAEAHQD